MQNTYIANTTSEEHFMRITCTYTSLRQLLRKSMMKVIYRNIFILAPFDVSN